MAGNNIPIFMKGMKYLSFVFVVLAGSIISARADHDDWRWRHHNRPVIVGPSIGIEVYPDRDDYYRRYHRSLEADVQIALSRRGYYHGPIDGDIGPGTRAAIRAYQYEHDLPVSGHIDRYLLRSLGL